MLSLHYSQFAFMHSMYQTRQSEPVGLKTVYLECKRDQQVYGQIHNNVSHAQQICIHALNIPDWPCGDCN